MGSQRSGKERTWTRRKRAWPGKTNLRRRRAQWVHHAWQEESPVGTTLVVALISLFLGAVPGWPHSCGWGFPRRRLGRLLAILDFLVLFGRL
jgi:hypothetical protein